MKKFSLLCILIICLGIKTAGRETVQKNNHKGLKLDYKVTVDLENKKYFSIKAVISGIQTEFIAFRMTSNYGRVEKLEDLIPRITISGKGKEITGIEKIEGFLWKIPLNTTEIIVDYIVNTQFPYSSLNMVRLPYRDDHHLYFPASSVFIFPDEQYLNENNVEIQKIRIQFELPAGWLAASSWGTDKLTFELDPPTLDTLMAGLVGVGYYSANSFTVNDLPVETAVLSGQGEYQDAEVTQAVKQGLKSAYSIFHFFPIPKFFAMVHFINEQPGRLNGNALGWSINLNGGRNLDRTQWLELASHIFAEIFHHWNGHVLNRGEDKSIIWFTEGVTNYYRVKNMLTSELITEEESFKFLSKELNRVFHSSRREDKLDELSRDYYSDRTAMDLTYSKGCCVTFALDLLIKKISSNQRSFDDVMKRMIERYNYEDNGHTYTHENVDETIKEILGDKYFTSYKKLYGENFISEFESVLKNNDLYLKKNKGRPLYFGILNFGPPDGQVKILSIDKESPAYAAGLRSGDILININGQKIRTASSIKEILETIPKNEPVKLMIIRNGKKISLDTLWDSFATEFVIKKKENNI